MSFEHLSFARHWRLSEATIYQLGQCEVLVNILARMPLSPKLKEHLKQVALVKGAQATTAIEGNTLTEEEIGKIVAGEHLAASKAYQEQEVKNIIEAMNKIKNDVFAPVSPKLISPELLQRYHSMLGENLPEPFNAVPGQFAQSQRVVAGYRCPPPGQAKHQVEGLVTQLCQWLQTEFRFASGKQIFRDGILQAIVTHVYIEWIHPFDDGNGRTGRLVEFYLMLRGGVADICCHILSNHYNTTRPEYYAHLRECQNERDLTAFISYAIIGFLDGLNEVWQAVVDELLLRAWREHVYDKFAEMKWSRPVLKRRRQLLLEMPLFVSYDIDDIPFLSPEIAREYARLSRSTVRRDIRDLIAEELLSVHQGTGKIAANIGILRAQYPDARQG